MAPTDPRTSRPATKPATRQPRTGRPCPSMRQLCRCLQTSLGRKWRRTNAEDSLEEQSRHAHGHNRDIRIFRRFTHSDRAPGRPNVTGASTFRQSDLLAPEVLANPYALYARLRAEQVSTSIGDRATL